MVAIAYRRVLTISATAITLSGGGKPDFTREFEEPAKTSHQCTTRVEGFLSGLASSLWKRGIRSYTVEIEVCSPVRMDFGWQRSGFRVRFPDGDDEPIGVYTEDSGRDGVEEFG